MLGGCVGAQGSNENVASVSIYDYAKIYTDWANYYLERVRSKKKVTDLSTDCRDGLLLADVIEAVTTFKVPDLIKKPKNQQQMFDNVNSCLAVLRVHSVGGLESITANDISNGRLKAVLALFFALSRYKQQSKQQKCSAHHTKAETHQQQQQPPIQQKHPQHSSQPLLPQAPPQAIQQPQSVCTEAMATRQIPAPYSKANGGTAIPLPATVLVQRRCPPDKVRPLPPTPNHAPSIPGLTKTVEINPNSRPGSPPQNHINYTASNQKGSNVPRQSQCKIPASPYSSNSTQGNNNTQYPTTTNAAAITNCNGPATNTVGTTKHSMLDKLKLFNKEKSSSSNNTSSSSSKSQVSKRTSSSSGFSSARSERSDSSLSLNDGHVSHIKPPTMLSGSGTMKSKDQIKGGKQSKLLGASQKATSRETLNIKSNAKHEKKDRSPSRKEESFDSQIGQLTSRNQKAAMVTKQDTMSRAKQSSKNISSNKLETRSESKSNLACPIPKPLMTTTGTGIPKPMAAIKGTTKQTATIEKRSEVHEVKAEKSGDISSNHHGSISEINQNQRMHIVNPVSVVEGFQNNPAHMNKLLQSSSMSMSDSLHSSSTHSGGGLHSNSSESSVIYRPSSESSSDVYYQNNRPLPPASSNNPIPNRKDNRIIHTNDESSTTNSKFHTVPSRAVGTIYEEDKPVNVVPMRPLLRGYNSHVTLPTRGTRAQHYVADYCETDIGQGGYCSDGDALRRPGHHTRFYDIDNGYLSEGSGAVHGKHFLSVMRARTQLPTTIEERIRNSRGSLDSIGTTASESPKMEMNGSPGRSQSSSRNGRDNWNKMPEPMNGHGQPLSPTSGRKDKSSPSHSRRNASSSGGPVQSSTKQSSSSSSSRTKGVPQSFGYVKRSNGSATGTITATDQQNILLMNQHHQQQQHQGGRTGHVSAVPRSGKIKVSGGTQTCTSDLQTKVPPNNQHRSFSLTGPGATQLSQSIRERLSSGTHSLPKTGAEMHVFQHRSTKSEKMYPSMLNRGPDVEIEPYYCLPVGTVQPGTNGHHGGGVVPWSQPTSPTPPNRGFTGPLSPTHAVPGQMPGCHRLTYPKKNDEVHGSAASLLSGGSSLYGSAEERQANEVRRLKRELSDARDQVMSLSSQLSTNAHVVAAFEQSLSNMTQRLQQLTATAERKDGELTDMRQTIELLRKQSIQAGLTTAHMQSMGVQTNCQTADALIRPPQISSSTSIEAKSKSQQPITANGGIANMGAGGNQNAAGMQRHHSSDSMCSLNSVSSGCSAQDKKKKKGWLRSSFTKAFSRNAKISKTSRHMSSTQSGLEQQHHQQQHHHHHHSHAGSNPAQLPSDNVAALPPPSPTKSPQKVVPIIENAKPVDAIDVQNNPIVEDLKKQLREKDLVLTDIRLEALSSASQLENLKDTVMKMRAEMITLKQNNERLQKLVTSRSLAGSEASLGNATSPNGSIGECRRYSLADGGNRPPMELPKSLEEEVEEENIPPAPAPEPPPPPLSPTSHIDLTPPPPAIEVPSPTHLPNATAVEEVTDHTDGKKISIAVYLGQPESFPKYAEEILESDNYYCSSKHSGEDLEGDDGEFEEERDLKRFPDPTLNEFVVAYTYISGKTTWQNLDYIVRKTFKDYVSRVDPGTNLGLNTDSITSYHLGEAKRGPEMGFPELLPCGYIVGNVRTLYICLQGVGCLAFDSLIPRSIVHRYISLLTEHRRLILCGPSGTGKSYLARKLAEFLVARSGRGNLSEAIATFNVDHKSSKELRQYLGHIAEQASMSNGASELPSVIILDNLHHASALGDVFSSLLSAGPAAKLPCIIGTMSQATCNTTNLQLHHNFRWVLTANHMEPVKGFLGRFLRRRLFTLELSSHTQQPELNSVLAWLPTVWQHINRFLENHSSSDVTIGPRLFLSCPLDLKQSQVWFTDIWNYHLAPYLVEAVREGVQLYGRRGGAWNDPSTFIRDTYPWPYGPDSVPPLRQINAEDVGLEADAPGNSDNQDPLLNMLMRLQEAANYSGNQEQESDCASLDSNITPDSSAGAE
ncbi:protein sickie isoform X4 [Hermetia illucens]|uniref:protein sickie isoform X4 n=1 Tax=Hermetia illucens TaxID=343691 RepID=UPI0018CC3C2A|nr:protein sickie isoform X4 [Hermetia illucens]